MSSIVSAEKGKTRNAYLILLHLKIKVKLMNFKIRRDQYDYFFFFLNENEVMYLCYTFPLKRFLRKVIAFYSFIIYRFLISNYDNIVFHCTRASGTKLGGGKKLLRRLLVLYFAIYFLFSSSGQDIPVIQKKEKITCIVISQKQKILHILTYAPTHFLKTSSQHRMWVEIRVFCVWKWGNKMSSRIMTDL